MFSTIKKGMVLLLGLLAIAVLAFNSYGVEPCLRFALANSEKRTGTKVDFTSASGNVLTGSLSVNGMKLSRAVEGRNAFSLDISHLTADLAVLRIFDPSWQFDQLHILGVNGDFKVFERQGGEASKLEGGNVFEAKSVLISNGDLTFTNFRDNPAGVSLQVKVKDMTVDEYRSDWSLYDLLYRSRVTGEVDGEPFTFTQEVAEGKQVVTWNLKGLPMAKWGRGWSAGALAIAGTADVQVVNSWPVEDPRMIQQAWAVAVRGGKSLRFQSEIRRGNFEGAQSLEDAGFGEVIAKGLGSSAVNQVKSRLDQLRGKIFGTP